MWSQRDGKGRKKLKWLSVLQMAKRLQSLPNLKKKLQTVFNKYIRQRDSEGGYFTCISCGGTQSSETMDAGHYFPVGGYDGLRFDEDNVHGECPRCNRFDDAHLIGYGENLRKKIGEARYKRLKEKAARYKANGNKWTRHDLEAMIEKYKNKLQ